MVMNIKQCRKIIENGWTIINRRSIESRIGKENFKRLASLAEDNYLSFDKFSYAQAKQLCTEDKVAIILDASKQSISPLEREALEDYKDYNRINTLLSNPNEFAEKVNNYIEVLTKFIKKHPLPTKTKVFRLEGYIPDNIQGIKFSIKCRLGYYSDDEILRFVDTFNTLPFSEIIVHPRIGKQMYTGEASLEKFKELIPLINKPLIYNGDIYTVEKYKSVVENISTDDTHTMLGRGLLTNPFLAEEIKQINDNQQDKNARLHKFVVDLYVERLHHAGGSPKIIGSMKELWKYMMNIFDDPQNVWRNVKKVNHLDEYEDAVEKIFKENKIVL